MSKCYKVSVNKCLIVWKHSASLAECSLSMCEALRLGNKGLLEQKSLQKTQSQMALICCAELKSCDCYPWRKPSPSEDMSMAGGILATLFIFVLGSVSVRYMKFTGGFCILYISHPRLSLLSSVADCLTLGSLFFMVLEARSSESGASRVWLWGGPSSRIWATDFL